MADKPATKVEDLSDEASLSSERDAKSDAAMGDIAENKKSGVIFSDNSALVPAPESDFGAKLIPDLNIAFIYVAS